MSNFNDPKDRDFINSQESMEDGIIPIDFEVIARDQSYLALAKDPDSLIESITNISTAYKAFGEEYGIHIKFDVDSVSETFKSIISSDNEKVFKLYLSKSFDKVRLAVFNKILISVTTLVDRITTKDILESDNIEMSVSLLDKLFDMMKKLNDVHQEIKIDSSDLLLKNIAKDMLLANSDGGVSKELNDIQVMEVLKRLNG